MATAKKITGDRAIAGRLRRVPPAKQQEHASRHHELHQQALRRARAIGNAEHIEIEAAEQITALINAMNCVMTASSEENDHDPSLDVDPLEFASAECASDSQDRRKTHCNDGEQAMG